MLLLTGAAIGLAVGLLRGGRLSALNDVRVRYWPALFVALGIQVAIFSSPLRHSRIVVDHGGPVYLATLLAVLLVAARNFRLPGIGLIFAGLLLNTAVVAANGGQMPVDLGLLEQAGIHWQFDNTSFSNVTPMALTTRFRFLGDILVTPSFFPIKNAYSVGDLLICLGGGLFCALASSRRPAFRTESLVPQAATESL